MQNTQYSEWMQKPQPMGGCPPGMEYLAQVDQLTVRQKKECLEIFTGWEQRNRFEIRNALDQQFFFAAEESSCFQRQCCGPNRGFVIHVTDNFGQEVMRFRREFKCCVGASCCADSCDCAFVVFAELPDGTCFGQVRQAQTCCLPEYKILDASGQQILYINGPYCVCDCCADFKIASTDGGQQIGTISKRWGGVAKEVFTDATTFRVTFPLDLEVKAKAILFGAAFLIDFMFFEAQNN